MVKAAHGLQFSTDMEDLVSLLTMAGYAITRRTEEASGIYPWEVTRNGDYINLGSSVFDAWDCALEDYLHDLKGE